jgi:tRNA1(Val) A37 N6-methylase TrmN6
MLAGLFTVPNLAKESLKILHLGTGAGTLPMFLISQLGDKIEQLVTVDIS